MPNYTDINGKTYNIPDWPGESYKAMCINRAYRNSKFAVVESQNPFSGKNEITIYFQCAWCKKAIGSGAVHGDHLTPQNLEGTGLFMGSTGWLELSCSECNFGSRNKKKMMLRSDYKNDRDAQGPQGGGSNLASKEVK